MPAAPRPVPAPSAGRGAGGQASVELVALLPVLLLVVAALWQGALVGWSVWSAGGAARAGARAAAVGADPQRAARAAVAAGLRRGLRAREVQGGAVRVVVRVPRVGPLPRVSVSRSARLRRQA